MTFTGLATINDNDLTVASSTITTVTGGIAGSTGSVDFTTGTRTDVDGGIALTGAGTVTLDAATITSKDISPLAATSPSVALLFMTELERLQGTGAGAGNVEFGNTLTINASTGTAGDQDLTITATTGNVTFTGLATINDNDLMVASSTITTVTGGIAGSTGSVDGRTPDRC